MSQKPPPLPPANNIHECLTKPPNSPVPKLMAIVVKVSQPQAFTGKDGRPGTRVPLTLRDPSGEIKFTYFNPPKVPELNDVVEISGGYVKPPYKPGEANELGLSQWGGTIEVKGKGTPPPVSQPAPPPVQDPVRAMFGLAPAQPQAPAAPQPQPQAPPQPQPQAVIQPWPNWPPQGQAQPVQAPAAPVVQVAVQPQVPAAPQPTQQEYPDADALCVPDLTQAMLTVAESINNLGLRLEQGFKEMNNNLSAIYQELNNSGMDIMSRFDEIYRRLVKNGIRPDEIFTLLAKQMADGQGLIDHKVAIGIIATDKGIDITDIRGE